MTQDNSSDSTTETGNGSGDIFNTAAGWVLFAAGLGLGLSILSGKYFHGNEAERPEQLGYVIEGVEEEGGAAAEMTMAAALNMDTVDVSAGEKVFAKCQACHSIEQGGANGVGPNLYGVMGASIASKSGFGYSSALSGKGGQWGWEEMNEWLKNPRGYVDGTTMGFAGLSDIEDRAAVALYLNENGGNLTVPEYVAEVAEGSTGEGELAEEPAAEGEEAPAEDAATEAAAE